MKKIFLLAVTIATFNYSANAQCVAPSCVPSNPAKPYCSEGDLGANLTQAGVGVPYTNQIKIKLAASGGVFPLAYTVTNATITSITNFPNGFTWVSSAGNTFPGGSSTCITIQGTPTLLQLGPHPFVINMSIATSLSTIPTVLDYILNVGMTTTTLELVNKDNFSFYPNPANEEMYAYSPTDNATVYIYDLVGKLVLSEKLNAYAGTLLSIKELASGAYVAKVFNKNGDVAYTQKIIKE